MGNTCDPVPSWLEIAEKEIGVSEVSGSAANLRILQYFKSTALHSTSDEVPWCAAFAGWCLVQAGFKGTRSAAARSYLNYGKELKEPKRGCIVVLKRGNSAWQGHVGFYCGSPSSETIQILGGNQSDKVSVENFKKNQVLGYRWPVT